MDTATRARLSNRMARMPGAKLFTRAHVGLLRLSRGRLGRRWSGMPVLLLITTGRNSGRVRTTPVVYLRDGDDLVLLPAAAGSDRTPAWWLNLQAAGSGTVLLDGQRLAVTARAAQAHEQDRLWPRFAEVYPDIETFRTFTERPLIFAILTPE